MPKIKKTKGKRVWLMFSPPEFTFLFLKVLTGLQVGGRLESGLLGQKELTLHPKPGFIGVPFAQLKSLVNSSEKIREPFVRNPPGI